SSCARIGAQRRGISAAFSGDSRPNVASLGQLGSAPFATPTSATIDSTTANATRNTRMKTSSDRRPPEAGGDDVDAHHHRHDQQDHGRGLAVLEGPDRVPQVETDS